jgi:predicted phosphodiesterase
MIKYDLKDGEIRKLLIITDTHLRDVDFRTIRGFKSTVESFFMDTILSTIHNEGITDIMFMGDITDKGYRSVGTSLSHSSILERLKAEVPNGIFGTLLGNHFFIEMQNNPELYWIQPHPVYKPTEQIYRTEPILQTPDVFVIGNTQFSCFHFHPTDKRYVKDRLPGIKTHIGLYHDDVVIPNSIAGYKASQEDLEYYYKNIDIAVHGHIHVPHNTVIVDIGSRKVPLIIPGSCSLTSSDERERHSTVSLPVFTLTQDSCQLSFVTLNIGTHNYRIIKKSEPDKELKKRITAIKHETSEHVRVDTIANFIQTNNLPLHYIEVIKLASQGALSMSDMTRLILPFGEQQISTKEIFNDENNT